MQEINENAIQAIRDWLRKFYTNEKYKLDSFINNYNHIIKEYNLNYNVLAQILFDPETSICFNYHKQIHDKFDELLNHALFILFESTCLREPNEDSNLKFNIARQLSKLINYSPINNEHIYMCLQKYTHNVDFNKITMMNKEIQAVENMRMGCVYNDGNNFEQKRNQLIENLQEMENNIQRNFVINSQDMIARFLNNTKDYSASDLEQYFAFGLRQTCGFNSGARIINTETACNQLFRIYANTDPKIFLKIKELQYFFTNMIRHTINTSTENGYERFKDNFLIHFDAIKRNLLDSSSNYLAEQFQQFCVLAFNSGLVTPKELCDLIFQDKIFLSIGRMDSIVPKVEYLYNFLVNMLSLAENYRTHEENKNFYKDLFPQLCEVAKTQRPLKIEEVRLIVLNIIQKDMLDLRFAKTIINEEISKSKGGSADWRCNQIIAAEVGNLEQLWKTIIHDIRQLANNQFQLPVVVEDPNLVEVVEEPNPVRMLINKKNQFLDPEQNCSAQELEDLCVQLFKVYGLSSREMRDLLLMQGTSIYRSTNPNIATKIQQIKPFISGLIESSKSQETRGERYNFNDRYLTQLMISSRVGFPFSQVEANTMIFELRNIQRPLNFNFFEKNERLGILQLEEEHKRNINHLQLIIEQIVDPQEERRQILDNLGLILADIPDIEAQLNNLPNLEKRYFHQQ